MRALVTGANGFVGTYLLQHLHDCGDTTFAVVGPKVASLANPSATTSAHSSACVDIQDLAAVKAEVSEFKPDVVYHLAGMSVVPECESDFKRAPMVNVGGTETLCKALLETGTKAKFIFISSADVYGKVSKEDLPIKETSIPKPANNYSLSKLMAEALVEKCARQGLNTTIVRPFNHIGAGQDKRFVASSFAFQLAQIKQGKIAPQMSVGNLEPARDFSDVKDVVRAYRLIAETSQAGSLFNLGSGRATRIQEILDTLLRISGLKVQIQQDPKLMRSSDVSVVYGSCEKAKRELGWEPQIVLEETLREMFEFWMK